MDRPLVCSLPECRALPADVVACPCYSAAIAEDIRTTWRHIDAPARRTTRRTTRDLCRDCWQDENPTEYAPVATRYGPCAECGAEALVVRSAVAVHFESSPFPPYMRNAPRCPECGGPADTGAGHDCEV